MSFWGLLISSLGIWGAEREANEIEAEEARNAGLPVT